MVTMPALSLVDPRVHSLKIPRRPNTWICVTKTVAIWSNILTNAVTPVSKKDILGILKNIQAAHGDSTASPFPPLRGQHVNLLDEKLWKCDAILWLCCNPGTLSRINKELKCYLCLAVWFPRDRPSKYRAPKMWQLCHRRTATTI